MQISPELIKRCIDNDRKAQYELYKACYSFLMRICYRYNPANKDDALDTLNQSFLKIVMNLKKFKGEAPFEVWIKRITINTVIDNYRRNKKMYETLEYTDINSPDFKEDPLEDSYIQQKLDADEIYDMIAKLPPMCQKIFNLYVIDGYTHKEIGEILGISDGTSKSQLFDARKKLQLMIAHRNMPKAVK